MACVVSVRCCYSLNQLDSASNRIYAISKPSRRYHSVFATLRCYIATVLGLLNRVVDPWMRCLTIFRPQLSDVDQSGCVVACLYSHNGIPPLPRLCNGIPPRGADYGSVRGVLLNNFYSARVSLLVVSVVSVCCCYGLNNLDCASNRIYAA